MATFSNQAQLSYNNSVISSNIAVGEITEVLSVVKTAVRSDYTVGGSTTYAVSLVNSGSTALTGLTLTDTLGSYEYNSSTLYPMTYTSGTVKYYVNGVLQSTASVTSEQPLVISNISVPAGGNAVIVYEASANRYAPRESGSTIVNTATVSGTGITDSSAQATVTAQAEPQLSITKSVSPVPVEEDGTLTYTFLIQNTGNTAADSDAGIVITDTFNPVLSNLTAAYNGTALVLNTDYTYTGGVFSTVSGKLTVPAATYSQNTTTGEWDVTPGTGTLVITGLI